MTKDNKHKYTQKVADTLPKKVADNKTTQAVLEVAGKVEETAEKTLHSITDFLGSVRSVAEVVGPEALKRTKQKVESMMSNMDAVLQKVDDFATRKTVKKTAKAKKPVVKRRTKVNVETSAPAKKTKPAAKKVMTPQA